MAYADESMRRVDGSTAWYLLAAALVPEDRCPQIRAMLREPLLWIADAVAGATGDHDGGHATCFETLRGLVKVVDVGQR